MYCLLFLFLAHPIMTHATCMTRDTTHDMTHDRSQICPFCSPKLASLCWRAVGTVLMIGCESPPPPQQRSFVLTVEKLHRVSPVPSSYNDERQTPPINRTIEMGRAVQSFTIQCRISRRRCQGRKSSWRRFATSHDMRHVKSDRRTLRHCLVSPPIVPRSGPAQGSWEQYSTPLGSGPLDSM